jgi:hypothetical protein
MGGSHGTDTDFQVTMKNLLVNDAARIRSQGNVDLAMSFFEDGKERAGFAMSAHRFHPPSTSRLVFARSR